MTYAHLRFSLPVALLSSLFAIACSKDALTSPGGNEDAGSKADLAPGQSCNYAGTQYAIGETFKNDCNTCTCTTSGIACTLMACAPLTGGASGSMTGSGGIGGEPGSGGRMGSGGAGGMAGSGGSTGKGGSSGAGGSTVKQDAGSAGCLEGGHLYGIGETFNRDCNSCTCYANGASCTKMACPPGTDAGASCTYNGKTYAVGDSFKIDCNTCSCTSSGVACTTMACLVDAGPACTLSTNLTFGHDGGHALYWDVNRLTAKTFTITRNYSMLADPDGGSSSTCSPPLPSCSATDAVTITTISADLADPDVQSVWGLPQDPVPLFGTDSRPADGTVYSIALDDGRTVLVGGQCASPTMSSCRYIPAGLVKLTQDLQKLAAKMLADPACKGL